PYARSQESQADEIGLMLAAAACFNPEESIPLWERMSSMSGGQNPPEFASTHPSAGTRIEHLRSLMPRAQAYRQKFCGAGQGGAQGVH
ncbi:MAG: M48 family metalloprotease, partial [Burkholderiaceae bacterium]